MSGPGPARNDVFVLGAGFSREIAEEMPLTPELFDLSVAAMRTLLLETVDERSLLDAYARFGRNVETWLTWLASDQPWLTEASHLRNRAAFADVSRGLASVILAAQNDVLTASGGDPPAWLHGLVGAWAGYRAAVISFNYDSLVEKTYEAVFPGAGPAAILYSSMPTSIDGAARLGGDKPPYWFPLYKLHGSITWYVFPGEGGWPIYDAGFPTGWGPRDDEAALLLRVGARQPLIVPPVVSKEPFFSRPELRDQWMRADHRLQEADRLFLLGYSLPDADLTVRFLLDRVRSDCEVIPVNSDRLVLDRVERLLQPRRVNSRFAGRPNVIKELAARYASGAAI